MSTATSLPAAASPAPVDRTDAAWLDAHWMPYTGTASSRPTPA